MKKLLWIMLLVLAAVPDAPADEFFRIHKVEEQTKEPRDKVGTYLFETKPNGRRGKRLDYLPCLRLEVSTEKPMKPDQLFCKVYYFDHKYDLIAQQDQPDEVKRGKIPGYHRWTRLVDEEPVDICFQLPKEVLEAGKWEAVVVFGDDKGASMKQFPGKLMSSRLKYPEKELVEQRGKPPERKGYEDPLIEHVVEIENRKQPQITFILRPPAGVKDVSEAKGVLALCMLARNVHSLKGKLKYVEVEEDERRLMNDYLAFADKHQLVILCWGSRRLWSLKKNWDEQSKKEFKFQSEQLDEVMEGWAEGVDEICEIYKIPNRNFLMNGFSGSAQYALRLALRQPKYFLAVHAHIPSTFDQPTPEGQSVLWCLTTGEIEGGYKNSLQFFKDCKALGYPMMYKAVMGLGHQQHDITSDLGLEFFEYALTKQAEKEKCWTPENKPVLKELPPDFEMTKQPWPEDFRKPQFVGDSINQEMFPGEQMKFVPESLRVPIPTAELAEIWERRP